MLMNITTFTCVRNMETKLQIQSYEHLNISWRYLNNSMKKATGNFFRQENAHKKEAESRTHAFISNFKKTI
jgi:hypothetical protein